MVKEAVDDLEQSTLSEAVKTVKQKLLTKQKQPEIKITTETPAQQSIQVTLNRGVVYVGHIPHGFYEEQMKDYFKQFGRVTRVRVVRSKKTGRSRGYGYVEFQHAEVAQIAAESMNNYLMCGRLLKATYIPPEKQHSGYFVGRQWSKQNYPRLVNRTKQNIHKNKNVDNKTEAALVERGLNKISNIEKKLEAVGIDYKIKPVEVPEPVVKKRKAASQLPPVEIKKRKTAIVDSTTKKEKKETEIVEPVVKKDKKKDAANEVLAKKTKNKIESKVKSTGEKKEKKVSNVSAVPKLKKKVVSDAPSIIETKKSLQTSEKQLPKKSKKKIIAEKNMDSKLAEKISTEVPVVKKLKQKAVTIQTKPVEILKPKKITAAAPVTEKSKKKKSSAAPPTIEKSTQKKISVSVPSVKKTKQKSGAQISLKKKGKKSVAA